MPGIEGKVVAITGASSGIGEATARLLAGRGARVVLGARRTDRLERLASEVKHDGGEAEFMAVDVTEPGQGEDLVGLARERFGRLDVVVNNAGVMPLSALEKLRLDDWNRMIDVNIRGVLHGIAAGLPVMREQGHGQFVNLSSLGGHRVTPQAAVYSATKYAVMAISEGLRLEVGDNIRVTIISPGATESELVDSITDETAKERMKSFRGVPIPASAVAASIAFAIEQPEEVDVNQVIVRPTANKA